jgi:sortase A
LTPLRAAITACALFVVVLGVTLLAVPSGGQYGADVPRAASSEPPAVPGSRHPSTAPAPGSGPSTPTDSSGPGSSGVVAARISVPRLGIDLPIVEGDGLDAPMHRAAHYPGTAWPRGGSNIYLYGHAREGMFLSLWDAQVGDEIVLDLVDGTARIYEVTRIDPAVPWDAMEVLDPTAYEQLTLQTCTGENHTDPRFLVFASPVG